MWERSEGIIEGRQGLDEALAGLDRDADLILEKRRWMLTRQSRGVARRRAQ